jgi:hypothetical protein
MNSRECNRVMKQRMLPPELPAAGLGVPPLVVLQRPQASQRGNEPFG